MVQEDWAYTMRRTMQVRHRPPSAQCSMYLNLRRKINDPGLLSSVFCLVIQEIVPGLYLGPYASAGKKMAASLKSAGITHIVCVRLSSCQPSSIDVLQTVYIFMDCQCEMFQARGGKEPYQAPSRG